MSRAEQALKLKDEADGLAKSSLVGVSEDDAIEVFRKIADLYKKSARVVDRRPSFFVMSHIKMILRGSFSMLQTQTTTLLTLSHVLKRG